MEARDIIKTPGNVAKIKAATGMSYHRSLGPERWATIEVFDLVNI
jgi:hypothetical protein